jgi:hypothetical protein
MRRRRRYASLNIGSLCTVSHLALIGLRPPFRVVAPTCIRPQRKGPATLHRFRDCAGSLPDPGWARRSIGAEIVDAAVAHIDAIHYGTAYWAAALDHPPHYSLFADWQSMFEAL